MAQLLALMWPSPTLLVTFTNPKATYSYQKGTIADLNVTYILNWPLQTLRWPYDLSDHKVKCPGGGNHCML